MNARQTSALVSCFGALLAGTSASAQVSFRGIGRPADGSDARIIAVNADGSVFTGYSSLGYSFRWTSPSFIRLGFTGTGFVQSMNAAGNVIVGNFTDVGGSVIKRWRSSSGIQILSSIGSQLRATALSRDGSAVYAERIEAQGLTSYINGMNTDWNGTGLPVGGNGPIVQDTASDGSITGTSVDGAFRWSAQSGLEQLGTIVGGGACTPSAISEDGTTIVGVSSTPLGNMAFRWRHEMGAIGLGFGIIGPSRATDVSGDGTVVVGIHTVPFYGEDVFVWTELSGKVSLRDYLAAHGASTVSSWRLAADAQTGPRISADGRKVLGTGTNPLGQQEIYVATIADLGAPKVSGRIVFQGLNVNSESPSSAIVELRDIDGLLVSSSVANLSSTGQFAINAPSERGLFDVAIKVSHWLRKVVPVDTGEGNVSGLSFRLMNGDADEDNEVGIGDYAVLSGAYGTSRGATGFVANADFNGDDAVDIADYVLLSENYGRAGDP